MSTKTTTFTKRTLMAVLLAGAGTLAAASFAMPGGQDGQPGSQAQQVGQAQAQRVDRQARRLAALKEKLQLQPAQEPAWQAFAASFKPGAGPAGKADRQARREAMAKLSTPERMDQMLARAQERQDRMVQRAQAVKGFYAQLSPEQQKVFDAQAGGFMAGKHRHRHGGHA